MTNAQTELMDLIIAYGDARARLVEEEQTGTDAQVDAAEEKVARLLEVIRERVGEQS
jgi:hypothetical protein